MKRKREKLGEGNWLLDVREILAHQQIVESILCHLGIIPFIAFTSINKWFLSFRSSNILAIYCFAYHYNPLLIQQSPHNALPWNVILKGRVVAEKERRKLCSPFERVKNLDGLSLERALELVDEVKRNMMLICYHQTVARNIASLERIDPKPFVPLLQNTSFTSFSYDFNKIDMIEADLTLKNEWRLYSPLYGMPINFWANISLRKEDSPDYELDVNIDTEKTSSLGGFEDIEKVVGPLLFQGGENSKVGRVLAQYVLFCVFGNIFELDDMVFRETLIGISHWNELDERIEKLVLHLLAINHNVDLIKNED